MATGPTGSVHFFNDKEYPVFRGIRNGLYIQPRPKKKIYISKYAHKKSAKHQQPPSTCEQVKSELMHIRTQLHHAQTELATAEKQKEVIKEASRRNDQNRIACREEKERILAEYHAEKARLIARINELTGGGETKRSPILSPVVVSEQKLVEERLKREAEQKQLAIAKEKKLIEDRLKRDDEAKRARVEQNKIITVEQKRLEQESKSVAINDIAARLAAKKKLEAELEALRVRDIANRSVAAKKLEAELATARRLEAELAKLEAQRLLLK